MWTKILGLILKSTASKVITASIIVSLLGGGLLAWHNFKEDLRDEGAEECIDAVARNNNKILLDQLTKAQARATVLELRNLELWHQNRDAERRRASAEDRITEMEYERKQQEQYDEEYKEWANTDLPDGVIDRVRKHRSNSAATDSN